MNHIIILTLLNIFSIISSIKLDSAEIIEDRLRSNGYEHFAEKTGIHQKLGGRDISPLGIEIQFLLVLDDYCNGLPAIILQKDHFVQVIIGDAVN